MTAAELRRAIEAPARLGGWKFEPGLVDWLLREAGDEPGVLPLLSHALLETWHRRRGVDSAEKIADIYAEMIVATVVGCGR